ncbi:MAG: OmpA family protein, partial [Shimia sp.]
QVNDDEDGAKLRLEGTLRSPDELVAVRAAVPQDAEIAADLLDDGAPIAFEVRYGAAGGPSVAGKLPPNLDADAIGAALGFDAAAGDPARGAFGAAPGATEALDALAPWLPEVEEAVLRYADGAPTLDVVAAPGVDPDLLAAQLGDAAGGVVLSVSAPSDLPQTGAERVNAASGLRERFSGVAWLPAFDFAPSLETCDQATTAILERTQVGFLTGSATLDARANRAVNALSGAIQHCLRTAPDLRVEVGGHTDAQGAEDANQSLSEARATAVQDALIARGVAPGAVTAIGFGESRPIADNETQVGRAANRRTTITWTAAAATGD